MADASHAFDEPKTVGERADSRRAFLKAGALAAGAAALGACAIPFAKRGEGPSVPTGEASVRRIPGRVSIPVGKGSDPLLRMQEELARAMAKPIEQRRWLMLIDTRKCIGCHACTVACIAENNLPPGVTYRSVHDEEEGTYPALRRWFMPTNCYQCANPPCVKAANAVIPDAMGQRPDGIVTIDYAKMKGAAVFAVAKKACPYDDALYVDKGGQFTDGTPAVQGYEKRETTEYGRRVRRADTVGVTRKCHFCIHRIEAGVLPACVATCTGQAMYFGDAGNPASLVAELSAQRDKTFVMMPKRGTSPSTVYLHNDPLNAETSCAKCHEGGNLK